MEEKDTTGLALPNTKFKRSLFQVTHGTSDSICQECKTGYMRTDGAHAVVQAPGPQPPLRDLKPAALPQQHVAGGHAHALRAMSRYRFWCWQARPSMCKLAQITTSLTHRLHAMSASHAKNTSRR